MALKEEKSRLGISLDGNTTLRRNAMAKQSNGPMSELQKIRRQNVDSGYSTSDGYDKRWSEELPVATNGTPTNGSPPNATPSNSTPSITTTDNGSSVKYSTPSAPSQPSGQISTPNLSPVVNHNNINNNNNNNVEEYIRPNLPIDNATPKRSTISNKGNSNRYVAIEYNRIDHSRIIDLLHGFVASLALVAIYM